MNKDTDAHLVPVDAALVQGITRPDPQLWTLFIIYSVMATVAFPVVILPYYFRYITLRYRFDDDGVSVSHGLIWRRETYLTYARIQDIHVTRNIFERWLGIGTVKIQTASGSASATESIVGLKAFQDVRNYLYARMRGNQSVNSVEPVRQVQPKQSAQSLQSMPSAQSLKSDASGRPLAESTASSEASTIRALSGIRDELRAVRELVEQRRSDV